MEERLKKIFEQFEKYAYNFIAPIDADYHGLVERVSNNISLLNYIENVSRKYSDLHNSIMKLGKPLYSLARLEHVENIDINTLEDELEDIHVKINTIFDVVVRFSVTVFKNGETKNKNFTSKLLKEIDNLEIVALLNELKELIDKYDDGKRNMILHEGKFVDKELKDIFDFEIIGWIQNGETYENRLVEMKKEYLGKKINEAITLLEQIIESIDELSKFWYAEYGKTYNELFSIK